MGVAAGVPEVGRGVGHDDIHRIDALADRTLAQRAVVDLFDDQAAEPDIEQRAAGVGIIFRRPDREVVVEVFLEDLGILVLVAVLVELVGDLDRAVRRQQFAGRICPEIKHCLK